MSALGDVQPVPELAKQIVADGYDRIAERYSAWTGPTLRGPRARYVAILQERLPEGAAVLELGCATGIPTTRELAKRFAVTGIELSPRQAALARANVPDATILHGDMTTLDLPAGSFDAVLAFYALLHVPRSQHAGLYASIARWLRPGGLFVATLTVDDDDGTVEADWLGAPMFFNGFDAATGIAQIEAAGLTILTADVLTEHEDGVPVSFLWIVAESPRS
jgi:SAM-dependent methyltransferase